jgi:hypothetical protein
MRPILFVVSALVVCSSTAAFAAKPKKAVPAAKKAPPSVPSAAPAAPEPAPPAASETGGSAPAMRGPTRIDFDDRLIQGQSNKSGAVYLYDRKELKIRSMIKKRENFRDEIVGSLYDT